MPINLIFQRLDTCNSDVYSFHLVTRISSVFNQGDEGVSWYVILKGSVNVVIHGKGVVTTLQDGDDFGQLALINNAPR